MRARICQILVLFFFIAFSPPLKAEELLTWEQCVSETRASHPDLSSALALLQQAEADKRITGGARLPQLGLATTTQQNGSFVNGSSFSQLRSYSLSAQQLLFDGQKTSSQVASNEESIKAAQYNYSAVSSDVRFALRSAFAELLKAQELLALTGEIADRRQKNVRLISLRYQGGREHIGALRQAQADLAQAEFEVAQAGWGIVLAQVKLASALGRDIHKPLRVQGAFRVSDMLSVKPDFELLAKNSPLFQQLDTRSKSARYDLDAARNAFAPELFLTSSVGRSSVQRWPFDAVDWSAGLTLSVPIYEGGIGRARVSKAMAVVSQQTAQAKSGFLQIFDTLQESWKSFQDARQMVVVQKKFLDAAIERSSIANAQYSNGLITFNDWVIIENNLVSAKKSYLNAGAALLIAEAQWIHAKGGALDGQQE
ncbi:MAG: TolC family protein [Chlorobium sp.]|nr:MAG: TolC family protein [Chlorobium sp.]